MTNQVDENDRRARYVVTNPAGQTLFAIDFPLGKATWVKVYVDGVVQTSGFTIDLDALTVTFAVALPEGTIVTLEGLQILERENGYPLGGELRSTLINYDMNFIVRSLQEMRRDIDRAVLLNKAEANATSNVMPKFIEGRAIVCGPNGIALSTANFVELDANLALVQEAADAVFTTKEDVDAALEAAILAQEAAEDAQEAAEAIVGFDATAASLTVDDADFTVLTGTNGQTVLDDIDDQFVIVAGDVSDLQDDVGDLSDDVVALADDVAGLVSGGWVPLQTQTVASAVDSVDFTSGIDGTYKAYALVIGNVKPVNNNVDFQCKMTTDGTFTDLNLAWSYMKASPVGVSGTGGFSSTACTLSPSQDNSSDAEMLAIVKFVRDTAYGGFLYDIANKDGNTGRIAGGGANTVSSLINGIQFLFSSGNIASGTFTLYGLAGA